jgi:hypothetical protein
MPNSTYMVELDGENRGVGRASGSPPRTPNLPFREAVGGVCPLGHGGGGGGAKFVPR